MSVNLNKLRIATQVRELLLQGITLKNTFKEMEEVWLSLYDKEHRCLIVDQDGTKVKVQLVNLYAIKLIKYMNSIIGLDMVPLSQQDPTTRTWKNDSIVLNIGGNRVKNHEHMYRLMLVNLFGLSEDIVDIAFNPTPYNIRSYVKKTYDIDLGDTEGIDGVVTLEQAEAALTTFLADTSKVYRLY